MQFELTQLVHHTLHNVDTSTPWLNYSSSSSPTPEWVFMTFSGTMLVLISGVFLLGALLGLERAKLLGSHRRSELESGARLLLGLMFIAALILPFLVAHSPALALVLVALVGLAGAITREARLEAEASAASQE